MWDGRVGYASVQAGAAQAGACMHAYRWAWTWVWNSGCVLRHAMQRCGGLGGARLFGNRGGEEARRQGGEASSRGFKVIRLWFFSFMSQTLKTKSNAPESLHGNTTRLLISLQPLNTDHLPLDGQIPTLAVIDD